MSFPPQHGRLASVKEYICTARTSLSCRGMRSARRQVLGVSGALLAVLSLFAMSRVVEVVRNDNSLHLRVRGYSIEFYTNNVTDAVFPPQEIWDQGVLVSDSDDYDDDNATVPVALETPSERSDVAWPDNTSSPLRADNQELGITVKRKPGITTAAGAGSSRRERRSPKLRQVPGSTSTDTLRGAWHIIRLSNDALSQRVPTDFVSVSLEVPFAKRMLAQPAYQQLMKNLQALGGGKGPNIRVGGNSGEQTGWVGPGEKPRRRSRYIMGTWLRNMQRWL